MNRDSSERRKEGPWKKVRYRGDTGIALLMIDMEASTVVFIPQNTRKRLSPALVFAILRKDSKNMRQNYIVCFIRIVV